MKIKYLSFCIISFFSSSITGSSYLNSYHQTITAKSGSNLTHYLDSLELLFTEVPQWLTTVYDSSSGGFYDNARMVRDSRFGPDLQSTAFALNILFNGNILSNDSISVSFKTGITQFVEMRFDSSASLYLDPHYKDKILQNERTLARVQGMASGILRKIGVEDKQVQPFKEANMPEHLRSLEHFKIWFKNQQWDRVWTAFDHIAMERALIKRLPRERADSIIQFVQLYASKMQDDDGLWGKGQPIEIRFSGAAKYGTFCMNAGISIPKPNLIYQTLIQWFQKNNELDFKSVSGCPICIPRNALQLLFYLKPLLKTKISENDQLLIAKRTLEMLRFYHRSDGGFMKDQSAAVIAPDDINLGKYDVEISDMNGTHLATTARAALYNLLDKPVPRIGNRILNDWKNIDK